jgi:hypothetical protein
MAFELTEMSTGNLVGVYSTQEAALIHVAEAIQHGGAEAVATLALAVDDPTGSTPGSVIAEGAALADLAFRGHGQAAT